MFYTAPSSGAPLTAFHHNAPVLLPRFYENSKVAIHREHFSSPKSAQCPRPLYISSGFIIQIKEIVHNFYSKSHAAPLRIPITKTLELTVLKEKRLANCFYHSSEGCSGELTSSCTARMSVLGASSTTHWHPCTWAALTCSVSIARAGLSFPPSTC